RIRLFFSFVYEKIRYPCALTQWFQAVRDHSIRTRGSGRLSPHAMTTEILLRRSFTFICWCGTHI
ncbi:hypothetical protein BOTBODRAFT_106294, partial [Botryobasidium botryosum FD-172 SS1]